MPSSCDQAYLLVQGQFRKIGAQCQRPGPAATGNFGGYGSGVCKTEPEDATRKVLAIAVGKLDCQLRLADAAPAGGRGRGRRANRHNLPAFERARLAYYAGGLVEAQGRYEEALAWHTEDGRAWLAAGIAMVDGGSPEGPACLREALKMAPSTDWAKGHAEEWFAVGEALLGSSDDLGIDCLEQAIRIDPIRTDMASFLVDRYLDQSASATAAA